MTTRRTVSRLDAVPNNDPRTPTPRGWAVCWRGEDVLEVVEGPGHLRSTATPPPGWIAPSHPFVDATALDHRHEHRLRGYLFASHTLTEFLDRLIGAGYDLAPNTLEHWDMGDAVRIYRDQQLVATAWAAAGAVREVHQPGPDVHAPHALTIYDGANAATLAALVANTANDFEGLLAALTAAGYRWGRVTD